MILFQLYRLWRIKQRENDHEWWVANKDFEESSCSLCEDTILTYFAQVEAKQIIQPGTDPELKPRVLQEPAQYKQYSVPTFTIFTHI
jgi:hypothetical protein